MRCDGLRVGWIVIGILMATTMVSPQVLADPVLGEVFPMTQPDGSTIHVRIWGDEFYTVVESLDGYTLVRDPETHTICYARLSADGNQLVSTGVQAESADPRSLGLSPSIRINKSAAIEQAAEARADFNQRQHVGPLAPKLRNVSRGPTTGDVVGITLIVDFSDDPATIPRNSIESYLNEVGYSGYSNNGSVRDYYYAVSDGALTYTNYVPVAYYRAEHPKSYYNDPNVSYGTRARELIVEALEDLDDNGFDFSQYDADNNGIIDAVNCFYAGHRDSAWAEGLWPHAWTVSFAADGVQTFRYQITDLQDSLRLSTFCHENGHMLMGWPDLYDYDYDSRGVGRFCLMAYGTSSNNPCEPCAYMKHIAGWSDTTLLTSPATGLSTMAGFNIIYKYDHPTNSNEYYLIENRYKTGRDSGLPDSGMAIWHIDTQGSNNNQEQTPSSHYLVTLVQADGDWDLENDRNYGDTTDLYGAPQYTDCTPDTYPNTNWWDGSSSGLAITNISGPAISMTFDFGAATDCDGNGIPDSDDIANCDGDPACEDCNNNGRLDFCDIRDGISADCDDNGVPDECQPDCDGNGIPDDCQIDVQGLVGNYYDTMDLSGSPISRVDYWIDFNWNNDSPMAGIGSDHFSIRWTGYILSKETPGTYTFYTETDDGVRLWIDDQLVINQWIDQSPTEWSGQIDLEADRWYKIKMEYYENGGGAVARLIWHPPASYKHRVPGQYLAPSLDCNGNAVPDVCDISSGSSSDHDGNGVPDECEITLVPGDLNCDGVIDFADINPFVLAISSQGEYQQQYPDCEYLNADCDGDGIVTFADINPFVGLLSQ